MRSEPDAWRGAPAPVPADVGIVAAMSMEVGYLVDGLKRVRKYHAAAMPVIEGELDGQDRRDRHRRHGPHGGPTGRRGAPRRPSAVAGSSPPASPGPDPELSRNDLACPGKSSIRRAVDSQSSGRNRSAAGVQHVHRPAPHGRPAHPRRRPRSRSCTTSSEADMVDMEILGGRRALQRAARPVPRGPHHQRRRRTDLPREVASLMTLGQLPHRRRVAGDLEPALEHQGLLDAPRAGAGGGRPAGEGSLSDASAELPALTAARAEVRVTWPSRRRKAASPGRRIAGPAGWARSPARPACPRTASSGCPLPWSPGRSPGASSRAPGPGRARGGTGRSG